MNAKHLFLTFAAIVTCAAHISAETITATDVISLSSIAAKGYDSGLTDDDDNTMSGWTFSSDATYACGGFFYSTAENTFGINKGSSFVSSASGGYVKSISIVWIQDADVVENYNHMDGVTAKLNVYARSSSHYSASAGAGDYNAAERCHQFTYNDGVTTYDFEDDYEYIALASPTEYGASLKSITIVWEKEVVTYYNITAGEITDGDWGTNVQVSKTSGITAGETITVTFVPKATGSGSRAKRYSLTSYKFDDMVFDLSCGTYVKNPDTYTITFPMPARDVVIDASFEIITSKSTEIAIDKSVTTLQSGVSTTISFTHLDVNGDPVPDYTASLISISSSDESVVYADNIVKVSDGNYTFTAHGLASGEATITISAAAKANYDASHGPITITVIPRQAALVAEVDGRYYVAKNTLTSSKLEAIEVYKHGDKYLYPEGFNAADVTWYISTLNSDGSEYSVQNEYDQFLAPTGLNFKFQAGSFTWYDAEGRYQDITTEKYIAYNTSSTKFTMGSYEAAAKDVLLSAFYPMTYSTSSTADAGIVDARNIKSTYGTICVPFDVASSSVTSSGATFYTIDSKIVSGSSLGGIMLSEPHTALVAGHSYIYEMKEGVHVINFTGSGSYLYNAEDIADDGLVGSLAKDGEAEDGVVVVPGKVEPKSDGNYVLSSDQLRYVKISPEAAVQQTIKAFRAYIAASEISAGAPAPGRKMIVSDEAESIVTAIVDIPDAMFINWNEPVYNIMGMQVGKGATGVLIQNGQKFFVQ